MHELVIIGGGPAGAAAAVYAARKRLSTLLIAKEFGGQSVVSEGIENWIGTVKISGADLAKNLEAHVEAYKADVVTVLKGRAVTAIEQRDGHWAVTDDSGASHEAKAVLVATGSAPRRLEAPGADEFEHKGLTYCASCDGPLFADQAVAVIGGGNAAFESAAQLLAYCSHVTLINRSEHFRADAITVEKLRSHPKLTIVTNAEVSEVKGDGFVTGIAYTDTKTGAVTELPVGGVFVEIGQIPNTWFVKDVVDTDQNGKIVIDPWTSKTSAAGIWAAGDCTNIRYHQNNIAAGEAVKALEDIYATLNTK